MWLKDENGNLKIDSNGNPIWVDEVNNSERAVDYKEVRRQIAELTDKAHNRKEAYDKIVSVLNENEISIEDLPQFITNSKSYKEKIDNLGKGGKNDSFQPLRDEIDALKKQILQEKEEKRILEEKQRDEQLNSMFLGNAYLKENSDPTLVKDIFKKNFKFEDGKFKGYLDGKKITDDNLEDADFDYCVKKMIDSYPSKNLLLVGAVKGGAGAKPGSTQSKNYSDMNLSDLMKLYDETTDGVLKDTLSKEIKNKME